MNNQWNTTLHFYCLPAEDTLLVNLPYDQLSQTPCCSDDSTVMYYPVAIALARIITGARASEIRTTDPRISDLVSVTANQSYPRKSEMKRCRKTWTLANKVTLRD